MARIVCCLALIACSLGGHVFAQDGSDAELRAKRLLVRGLTMLEVGDAPSARASLEMALHLSPNNPAVLAAMADTYRKAGDLAEAIHYGGRALSANPGDLENAMRLASTYLEDGNPSAARDALDRHRRVRPGIETDVTVARFLGEHDLADDALTVLEAAHRQYGSSTEMLAALTTIRPRADILDRWTQLVASILDEGGDGALALDFLNGLDDDAHREAVHALLVMDLPRPAAPPEVVSIPTRRDLARGADARSEGQSGEDLLAIALQNPRDVRAWERAAESFYAEGLIGMARNTAEEATMLFPGNDRLTSVRLRSAFFLSDKVSAMTAAEAALRHESNVELAYAIAAWAAEGEDDLGREARDFIGSVAIGDAPAALIAALALQSDASSTRQVRRLISGVGRQTETSPELAGLRGMIEAARGDQVVARQWLERSVELGGSFPTVLEQLAGLRTGEDSRELLRRAAVARSLTK